MTLRDVKKKLDSLQKLPLHPQFLITRGRNRRLELIAEESQGVVLDIGCGQRPLEALARDHGFEIEYLEANTSATYTGAALFSLGLAIGFSEAVQARKWLLLFSPIVVLL